MKIQVVILPPQPKIYVIVCAYEFKVRKETFSVRNCVTKNSEFRENCFWECKKHFIQPLQNKLSYHTVIATIFFDKIKKHEGFLS